MIDWYIAARKLHNAADKLFPPATTVPAQFDELPTEIKERWRKLAAITADSCPAPVVLNMPLMNKGCTCGEMFRDAEDFRGHLPCPGTKEQQVIADLVFRYNDVLLELAILAEKGRRLFGMTIADYIATKERVDSERAYLRAGGFI
jgi:hypothetical protein